MSGDKVRKVRDAVELDRKLNAASGGLLLIWIGVAMATDVGWAVGLSGVGVVLLAEQAARAYLAVKYELFWVVVGNVFLLGGILMQVGLSVSLVPVALIVVGIALLASTLRRKPPEAAAPAPSPQNDD